MYRAAWLASRERKAAPLEGLGFAKQLATSTPARDGVAMVSDVRAARASGWERCISTED
jgi:hypothetical protein